MAEKKSSYGNPAWLRWIVIAFILYAGYQHFSSPKDRARPVRQSTESAATPSADAAAQLPEVTDNSIEIGGDIRGSGSAALCGQRAVVKVAATLPDGTAFEEENDPDAAKTVRVGIQDTDNPWATGLPGMAPGGVREIKVPAAYLFDDAALKQRGWNASDPVRFRIQLESLEPQPKNGEMPMRVTNVIHGRGQTAYCGDQASIHLVLWKLDGTLLYDSAKAADAPPIGFQLGDASIFYGLDRAVLGMTEGSQRSAVIPPAFLASPGSTTEHPVLALLPKGQVALADITLLTVSKPPKN